MKKFKFKPFTRIKKFWNKVVRRKKPAEESDYSDESPPSTSATCDLEEDSRCELALRRKRCRKLRNVKVPARDRDPEERSDRVVPASPRSWEDSRQNRGRRRKQPNIKWSDVARSCDDIYENMTDNESEYCCKQTRTVGLKHQKLPSSRSETDSKNNVKISVHRRLVPGKGVSFARSGSETEGENTSASEKSSRIENIFIEEDRYVSDWLDDGYC